MGYCGELIRSIEELKRSHVRRIVEKRISEFKELGRKENREIFKELCFCILCANYSAERAIKIQKRIDDGFITLSREELAEKLKEAGHRFPSSRAKYIVSARKYCDSIKEIIESFNDPNQLRRWLVRNILGIGLKEASHFLRNVGFKNVAIIDRHILKVMVKHGLIEKTPKTLTRKKYLELEEKLKEVAEETGLSLAELDLYLWYMETGRILK